MLLAVDIGNTNVTLGLYDPEAAPGAPLAPTPLRRWALSSQPMRTADEYRLTLRALLAEGADAEAITETVVASVVPPLTRPIMTALRQAYPAARHLEVGHATPMPVRNLYRAPAEVGLDRLANAAGAVALFAPPIIVVDLGTATTFDLVDASRAYLGGVIVPGPALMAEALSLRTARLPRIAPERPARIVGGSTVEALQSGLYWGTIGAIDYLVEAIERELGWEGATVVATGGEARAVMNDARRIGRVEPDLTLFGLSEIWRHGAATRHGEGALPTA